MVKRQAANRTPRLGFSTPPPHRKGSRGKIFNSHAVALIRVSTDRERQELGADAQRAAIERWAAQNGVKIVSWHLDEASGGAPIDKRQGLLEALESVIAHRAGLLVVQKLDRFSRDPVTAALA